MNTSNFESLTIWFLLLDIAIFQDLIETHVNGYHL